jgi:hypothetical protein
MLKVDRASVKALELTAPGSCKADSLTISRQLRNGEIFGKSSQRERELIWSEMLSISTDRLIPSLFSFFEDGNYLQGLADCVKQLVQLSDDDSLSAALRKHYSGIHQADNQCTIQQSESAFMSRPGSLKDRVELGGRQIWAGAMRKYIGIPVQRKKPKQDLLAKPIASSNDTALCELAALAYTLGFDSNKIQSLRSRSSDREMARNVLLEARRPNCFQYDAVKFEEFVEQIVGFFRTAKDITEEEARLTFETEYSNKAPKRCGIPRTQDYEQDQPLLFLDNLHDYKEETGGQMTSFFIRRSVYLAFFGEPSQAEKSFSEQERPEGEIQRTQQERLDNERLDDERFDNERLENERIENERIENERIETERIETERIAKERDRLENERLENERIENERLANERFAKEQERLENERIENERLAKERDSLENERLENERLENERLENERIENERIENERLAKERDRLENERLENERLENERLENERIENERIENERLAKERDRLENERLENEQLENERIENERLAKERDRLENERLENERIENERIENERLAKERDRLENERL